MSSRSKVAPRKFRHNKWTKFAEQYTAWRNGLPFLWRIACDIASMLLLLAAVALVIMVALQLLLLVVPLLLLLGLLRGSANSRQSDQQWYEDNDPRGTSGPRSMAPNLFD